MCYNYVNYTEEKIMPILSYLKDLEKDIRADENERSSINTSIDTLKLRLNNYFGSDISKIFVFGSYDRNTNLCRKADESSDVDIMIVFNDIEYKPQTYINWLKKFLDLKYPTSTAHQSNPCAILELSHIRFELTPAIKLYSFDDTSYKIPDKQSSYLDWITTKPFEIDEISQNKKEIRYKQVIRLVKYWNCLNDKYFASYELEKKVYNSGIFVHIEDLKQNLFQVLKSFSEYEGPLYVRNYITKTKDVIRYVENNEKEMPYTSLSKLKNIFKELK